MTSNAIASERFQDELTARLKNTARRLRLFEAFRGAVYTLSLCGVSFSAMLWLDRLLVLPSALRMVLVILFLAIVIISCAFYFIRPLTLIFRHTANIRLLEQAAGIDDNILINFWYLQNEHHDTHNPYNKILAAQSDQRLGAIPVSAILRPGQWKVTQLLLVLFTAAIALTAYYQPRLLESGWQRYVYVFSSKPPVSSLQLAINPEKTVTLFSGDDLAVTAFARRDGVAPENDLELLLESGKNTPTGFVRNGKGRKMTLVVDAAGTDTKMSKYSAALTNINEDQEFIVNATETWTEPVSIKVLPRPYVKKTLVTVIPPKFSGLKKREFYNLSSIGQLLPDTSIEITQDVANHLNQMWYELGGKQIKTQNNNGTLTAKFKLVSEVGMTVNAKSLTPERNLTLDSVTLRVNDDPAPEVMLKSESPKLIALGSTVDFLVSAKDNLGLKEVGLVSDNGDDNPKSLELYKKWKSSRAPGKKAAKLKYALILTPGRFLPGQSYVFKAYAQDYNPRSKPSYSIPLTIRIANNGDLSISGDSVLAKGFKYLRDAVEKQKSAISFSENLEANLPEVIAKKTMRKQYERLNSVENGVRYLAERAYGEFKSSEQSKIYADTMKPLIDKYFPDLIKEIDTLPEVADSGLNKTRQKVGSITGRQTYIYTTLQQLLGKVYQQSLKENGKLNTDERQSPVNAENVIRDTIDALKKFTEDQRKILEKSKSLLDKPADDVSDENEKILGELAKKEAELAAFLQEKLTDFSKIPSQDFSDSGVVEEFNEVYQEIQKAAAELYAKRIELAVPREQAGLESAETLVQNLERWLPDHADNIQWVMEELDLPPEAPVAELPDELEDIIGDLLEQEEDMTADIEDIGSTFMDSLDKGAGWGAADGPISNMSARGVTGNTLPNNMEISGRSGEGRSGRSSGQMVEATAEGKGGRKTPSRMTPTPFETGSVDDKSKEEPGGATGGGKLSGFSEEGLRGPVPADLKQKMARMQQRQTGLRQKAEQVMLQLRKQNLPDSNIKAAIKAFREIENSLASGQAQKLRQSHKAAIDALKLSKQNIAKHTSTTAQNEDAKQNSRSEIYKGMRESAPRGYEKMTDKYFDSILSIE